MEFGEDFYIKLFRLLASNRSEATAEIKKMQQETMAYYDSQGWIDHGACAAYVKKLKVAAEESAIRRQARKDAARLKSDEAKSVGVVKKSASPKRISTSTSPSASPRRSTSVDKTETSVTTKSKPTITKAGIMREEDIKREPGADPPGSASPGQQQASAVKRTKSIANSTPSFEQAIAGYDSDPGLIKKEVKKEKQEGNEKRKAEKRKLSSEDDKSAVKQEPMDATTSVPAVPVVIPVKKKMIPVTRIGNAVVTVIGAGGSIPTVVKLGSPPVQEDVKPPIFLSVAANVSVSAGTPTVAHGAGLFSGMSESDTDGIGKQDHSSIDIDNPPFELPAEFVEVRSSSPAGPQDSGSAFDEGSGDSELCCIVCKKQSERPDNKLLECLECHNTFHQKCHTPPVATLDARDVFHCLSCQKNLKKMSDGKPANSSTKGMGGSTKRESRASVKLEQTSGSSDNRGNSGKTCVEMKAGIRLLAEDFIAKHKKSKTGPGSLVAKGGAALAAAASSRLASSHPLIPLTGTLTPVPLPPGMTTTAAGTSASSRNDTLNRLKAGMGSASALSASINKPPPKLIQALPMPPASSSMRIPMVSADKRLQQMKKKAATKKSDRAGLK